MNDFDLIGKLRSLGIPLCSTAADRVAALIKERAALTDKPARVRVRPMEWVQSLSFPHVSAAWCPVLEDTLYAEKPGDRERIEAERAARILSVVITGADGEA